MVMTLDAEQPAYLKPPPEPPPISSDGTGSLDFLHYVSDTQLLSWIDENYTTPVRLGTLRSHQI